MFLDNPKTFDLIESQRFIIGEALEAYRNEVTARLYDERDPNRADAVDIELLEIDEILELIGE